MELIRATDVPESEWPDILRGKHTDWPFFLQWVPRSWTAYFGEPPKKIAGNAPEYQFWYKFTGVYWKPCAETDEGAVSYRHPFPIPERGEWWKGTPDFYASKSKDGLYYRNGYRWDNIEGYYEYPSFTVKIYP